MYKNCYVTRGREWNHYNIHLWTDEGYSMEYHVKSVKESKIIKILE